MTIRNRSFDYSDPTCQKSVTTTIWAGTDQNRDYTYTQTKDYPVYRETYHVGSMEDHVVPQFQKRRARGEVFNNPMERNEVKIVDPMVPMSSTHRHKEWKANWSPPGYRYFGRETIGSYPVSHFLDAGEVSLIPVPASPVDESWLINQAVTQAWANADLSEAAALATIAESRESVTSIYSILKRVLKIARYAKKLQVGKLAKELSPKELADRWMEVRYALRPLVYDAKAITAALDAKLEHDRQTFRGFKSDADVTQDVVYGGGAFRRTWNRSTIVAVEVRSGVLTQIESLHALNTWGFDSILETAWELVPLSFVFDWFWNLGSTLASWTPEVGLKTLASWYVLTRVHTQMVTLAQWSPYQCTDAGICMQFSSSCTPKNYIRTETWKYRVPDPNRAVLPSFRINLNAAKLLDLSIIGKKKLL